MQLKGYDVLKKLKKKTNKILENILFHFFSCSKKGQFSCMQKISM